jgi:aspartyl/asparaginyl beta-hydroxylase (cupin superfamily)
MNLFQLAMFLFLSFFLIRYLFKHYIGVSKRFYSSSTFPALAELSQNCDQVTDELRKAGEECWYQWPERHLIPKKTDDWRVCPLFGFEIWHPKNIAYFPKTCELLRQIPGLKTAVFSRLGPGTRLTPHQGWSKLSNKVLRCHMGIDIPPNARSGVEVENEFHQIERGKWLVFDDSKYHIGLNESTEKHRIVLLLDIERPWWVRQGESRYHQMEKLDAFLKAIQMEN